ncbi:MAG: Gfo/Idh/MocA family protein [Christensenellales bacterium]|jgi:predicted dehydrogenase
MQKYNVGLIGGGFMGRAHSLAYAGMPLLFWPAPGIPVRKSVCEVNDELAEAAKERLGYEKCTSNWMDIIDDPDIDIVDISTPNNTHAEIAVAAARAGKHILCEKPIARTTGEAVAMMQAAEEAGVKHQLAFNYRRLPAVLRAKKFIEEGAIGEILTYRGTYLSGKDADVPIAWRNIREMAGYGSLGDIGTHCIDIARYLVGDFASVSGMLRTFVQQRPAHTGAQELRQVETDDQTCFSIQFANGAIGTIETSSGNSWGHYNGLTFEIYGRKGSIFFNYEHRDELKIYFADDPRDRRGFRTISVGGADHPYDGHIIWPTPGMGIGYAELKIIECYEFIKAIKEDTAAVPSFRDGYEISVICDAIAESNDTGKWVHISYR